jgi:hypothetical protein
MQLRIHTKHANTCGKYLARWEPQKKGVMSIAASFPSVKKPRYVDLGEERQTTEGDADWLNSTPTRALFTTLVDSSSASSNAKPAHTQPSTLFPTYD